MLELLDFTALLPLILAALGVSFVITGATIGRPLRFIGWWLLRRARLDALVTCPYCNAWWCGLVLAVVTGHGGWQALQTAFTTCLLAAIVQAQWALAANEDFEAEAKALKQPREDQPNGQTEETS